RANLSVSLGGGRGKALHRKVLNQLRQFGERPGSVGALNCAVLQFCVRYYRHDRLLGFQAFEPSGHLRVPVLCKVDANVRVQHVAPPHRGSRSCGGVSWRPSAIKSSGKDCRRARARRKLRFGFRSMTSSPRRKISTSFTSKRNSLGRRTAWLFPDLKTRALLMVASSRKKYIRDVYTMQPVGMSFQLWLRGSLAWASPAS